MTAVMSTFNDIYDAAQGLPAPDRIRLIDALWETVAPEDWPAPSEAWLQEAQRRSAEYESGSVRTVPWEQIRADALRRVGAMESNAAG